MLQNLIDIFTAPKAVYARILEKPSVFPPLLLQIVALASAQVAYFATVNHGFLVDQMIEQVLATNPSARVADIRRVYENMSPNTMGGIAIFSITVVLSVILLLTAVYLNFVSKFGHEGRSYRQWLSLVCWTNLPILLGALAAWVVILTGNGQVPLTALQPLSLDAVLGLHSGKSLLQNLNLLQFWSLGLLVLGYQHFTNSTLARAAAVTLAPYVVIYGIWAWLSFK
ncbi:MAG: YIP1 family protein [Pseudomonadales bacterium]|jgi:hypothetical protein|nr:YIP1 family protein [Pseudomonadales bacterium]